MLDCGRVSGDFCVRRRRWWHTDVTIRAGRVAGHFLGRHLSFGDVPMGTTVERELRIYNQGSSPLTVTGMTGPGGYTATWTSGTIPPNNGSQQTKIRFTPTENRTYNGTLTVNGNQQRHEHDQYLGPWRAGSYTPGAAPATRYSICPRTLCVSGSSDIPSIQLQLRRPNRRSSSGE